MISSIMRSSKEGLFDTRSVSELLWGYQDPLLKTLKTLDHNLDDMFGLFYKVKTREIILVRTITIKTTPAHFRFLLTEQRLQ